MARRKPHARQARQLAVARLNGIFDALRAAHRIDIDFLSNWDDKLAFSQAVGVPYIAALLGELTDVLDVDDIVEWEKWPDREMWLDRCRRTTATDATPKDAPE